jgi:hypothetical protein
MSTDQIHPFEIPNTVMEKLAAGGAAWRAHDYDIAKMHAAEASQLAEAQHSLHGMIGAKHLRALIAFNERDDALSHRLHIDALNDSLRVGYLSGAATSLVNLALIDIDRDDLDSAQAHYRQALIHYQNCGDLENAGRITHILKENDFAKVLHEVHRVALN